MKITILTYGSRGDVQPFLALALGLQKAGHMVKLTAPHRYRFTNFVAERDVPFVSLAGNPKIISQRLNDAGRNPLGMMRDILDYAVQIGVGIVQQTEAACQDANLIINTLTPFCTCLVRMQSLAKKVSRIFAFNRSQCLLRRATIPMLLYPICIVAR